jgi:acyl carrier protein
MENRIEIQDTIVGGLGKQCGFDEEEIRQINHTNTIVHLNIDSLDLYEFIERLEIRFGIDISENDRMNCFDTIGDIVKFIEMKLGVE